MAMPAATIATMTFTREIDAPPAEVYRAFTTAVALREWMSDGAQVDAREGGAFILWWNSGFCTRGNFKALDKDKKLTFTWFGSDEPTPTSVTVTLEPKGGGTFLTMTHDEIGSDSVWDHLRKEIEDGWNESLENLQSVLETGDDLRVTRRPMLGIIGGSMLTAEDAKRLGLEGVEGLRIDGTVEGMGAQKAGIGKDAVIVRFDGVAMTGYNALIETVSKHKAGDRIEVEFYKDGHKQTATMELSKRPMSEVPGDPKRLAELVKARYDEADRRLGELLAGVSEEQASRRPAEGEWNAKEVLAHLLDTEIDQSNWIGSLIQNEEVLWFADNEHTRVAATVEAYGSLAALLEGYRRVQRETLAFLANLPPHFVARKGSYVRVGRAYLDGAYHSDDHYDQVKTALGK